jgi:Spy/CpxP family protein refolding chaperone
VVIPSQPSGGGPVGQPEVASADVSSASRSSQSEGQMSNSQSGQRDGGGQRENRGDRRNQNNNGNNGGGGQNFEQRRQERIARMKTDLGLTDDQAQKIQALFQAQFSSTNQPGGQVNRDERRAAFEKVQAEVEKILTPEQKTKWEAMRQQWGQRRGGGGGGQRQQGGGGNK